jgi:hypothetical protein
MSASITARQISMGLALHCTMDLFCSARDLVEENECHIGLEEDEEVHLSKE